MNDVQRYQNLAFAFEPVHNIPTEPMLLVDDFVSSSWTFTITSMTLRKGGDVKAVTPFALAKRFG
jgi:predicted amidophosphoribosyltransferase